MMPPKGQANKELVLDTLSWVSDRDVKEIVGFMCREEFWQV